ncbi:hypothetical protein K437DRAFT_138401 [Tilletiaria anomala UBC 951]|uniref:Galactose oxidase n=1 Tax=Tilletiaria anomala (strain ATCC 24038 / CBS 436.72 / UBC 951) TaxID=1037660 RepID=A0A066VVS8_TILAU|nr:uncharacterized protein K437DRAFT_138401 [Tilletiaria anomala UBC 951]KDN44358.1 hypothetical protein K437DRAFT_138401 [Tilletiaria anomala UBC 951]
MAIFGKKKDKADGATAGSPTQGSAPPGTASSSTGSHGGKGSISNGAGAPSGGPSGLPGQYGSPSSLSSAGGGPPGAASGFKFGGPAPRQDMGSSGIPAPGGGVPDARTRKLSDEGIGSTYQMPSIGATAGGMQSGLPLSSAGAPLFSGMTSGGPSSATGTNSSGSERGSSRPQQVVYPWSQRQLIVNPPRFLDANRQAPPGTLSPSPFPRYGLAANQTASATGEVYLFGGLVRESVKNDLYIVHVDKVSQSPAPPTPGAPPTSVSVAGGVSATLVQTTGDIPPPRVGHATVLVSNVLILWGGDTKVRADDQQDEGLYLLNLSTREWTRVVSNSDAPKSCPVGRYGHTVSIVGSKFYVFGGQVDGLFLNDLWSFDLNSLKGNPTWELLKPNGELPPQRTGHASVTYKDKIYIFGGTDGQYHYNDTWCYEVATNTWSELSCIGYIPVPREGHSTCLVDDVMYIFGGRGVDGKDLGDLASFKISNQRWYMFANMGPSPSGRSGHALTTFQNKVIVLGGESFTGSKPDDPAIVHVLDTGKIKYPPDSAKTGTTGPGAGSTIRKSGAGPMASGIPGPTLGNTNASQRAMSPNGTERAASPTQRDGRQPLNGIVSMMNSQQQQSPPPPSAGQQQHSQVQTQSQSHLMQQPQSKIAQPPGGSQISPAAGAMNQQGTLQQAPGPAGGAPQNIMRSVSPTQQAVQQQRAAALSGAGIAPTQPPSSLQSHAISPPVVGGQGSTYIGPRSQRSLENMRSNQGPRAGSPSMMGATVSSVSAMHTKTVNGFMNLTPPGSQQLTQDGFYQQPNTFSGPAAAASALAPSNSSAELEVMKKREAWMKAALAMAVKKGFIAPEQLQGDGVNGTDGSVNLDLDGIDTGVEGTDKDRIVRALITLKTRLAQAQSTIAEQAQQEGDKVTESERSRAAALQEAAFYRAKLHALESNNLTEASRLEHERTMQLETRVTDALREKSTLERQLASLREQTKLEQQLRTSAEERLSETAKRAMSAEAAQMKAYEEVSALQKRSYNAESALREHGEQLAQLTSLLSRQKSDHEFVRGQLDDANATVDQHLASLTQLQAALDATSARASEHERLHYQHRDLTTSHQQKAAQLQAELQQKTSEVAASAQRIEELEAVVANLQQEANTHRQASQVGLAEVLNTRQLLASRNAEGSVPSHVIEKMRALEDESDSLRQMHASTRAAADHAAASLSETRERNTLLEKQHSGLRSELSVVRSQLAIALQELARLKDQASAKDVQLRDSLRAAEAAEIKAQLLKSFMSERGITVPGDSELSTQDGFAERKIQSLQAEVDERTKQVEDLQKRVASSQAHIDSLGRNAGMADNASLVEAQRRAELAEKELADTTASYKERMAQLESDYQTAVQFVKGTEKMLRRMKDELTKYKTENAQLQADVTALRAGTATEDGSEAARDIEALRTRLQDVTQQSEEVAAENRELERRMAVLISEQKDAHDRSRGLADSHADSTKKVQVLESEVGKLESNLNSVREELQKTLTLNQHLSAELNKTGDSGVHAASMTRDLSAAHSSNDQLKQENQSLAQRLHETEEKVS